jgi:YVTN family beta-propeller protein
MINKGIMHTPSNCQKVQFTLKHNIFNIGYALIMMIFGCNKTADYPNRIIDEIPINSPGCVAVIPDSSYLYVTSVNDISVIQTSNNQVIATIPVSASPFDIAVSSYSDFVYVISTSGQVSVIRVSDHTIVDTITVGSDPGGITILPDGEYIYVTKYSSNSVLVIRSSDDSIITTIPVSGNAGKIISSPNSEYVYAVIGEPDNQVVVIRTSDNAIIDTVFLGNTSPNNYNAPYEITILPNGEYLYVTTTGGVAIIRTADNMLISFVSGCGLMPQGLASLPNGRYVYTANWESNNISIIQTSDNTVVETIQAHGLLQDVAVHPNGEFVYVTNTGNSKVLIIGY